MQQNWPLNQLPETDSSWTLFLDRDGVINRDVVDDYVKSWEEFEFCEGTLEALHILNPLFGRIVIVSNQRGVGRGLMTHEILDQITRNMLQQIEEAGGRIDNVYYCTSTDNKDPNRKPNLGMALQAKAKFPEINFAKSLMAGNMTGDLLFGRNIGAYTVYLPTRTTEKPDPSIIDASYKDLLAFAEAILNKRNTQ
jgi:D-glycero-D-manno-heptose 1,7-bisphosphate phosphatase